MTERIDVCLASYCGEAFILEQVRSVVAQLQPNDRLLVADDGSQDGTTALIRGLDPRLVIVSEDRAGGVVKNFERALSASTADIVVLCDQDDVWLPGRLDLVRERLRKADLVIMDGWVVDGSLRAKGTGIFELIGARRGFAGNFVKNSYIGCCMAMRREVVAAALPFPFGVVWHDWYIGLLASAFFSVSRCDEKTILYRRHGKNHSPTGEESQSSFSKKIGARGQILYATFFAGCRLLVRRAKSRVKEKH